MDDLISRQSIKEKLQEHHDFLVESNNGWIIPSVITKARIDEINNCIAMVVNEPSVQPEQKVGRWIYDKQREAYGHNPYICPFCGSDYNYHTNMNYCMCCGAKLEESEDKDGD